MPGVVPPSLVRSERGNGCRKRPEMYESYWGLEESPFTNRPGTKWFHESPTHEEALARLFYLIENRRGFGLLAGPSGTGKSTTLGVISQQVRRSQRAVSSIDLQGLDGHEMLWRIAVAMHVAPREADTRWSLWRRISDQLEAVGVAGKQSVIVLDHLERADASCFSVLERLAAQGNSHDGSVTLISSVRSEELSRVPRFIREISDLHVELGPLSLEESGEFIRDLLSQVSNRMGIFGTDAIARIHAHSRGVPRNISRICECSMIAAMAQEQDAIDAEIVDSVADGLVTPIQSPAESIPQQLFV